MEWEDPNTKESHPNKPLIKHLEEINKLYNKISSFYNIDPYINKIMYEIIKYHDNGKLNKMWNINNENNPPHAEYSIKYLKEHNMLNALKNEYNSKYFILILYFILKHHLPLYDRTGSKDKELQYYLQKLCNELVRDYVVKDMAFEERINFVDAFGIFKLADSLSASNILDYIPRKPTINKESILRLLTNNDGNLDKNRWNEQLRLCSLCNLSILTAYTGWGKTDSSLLYFINKDVNKVFYIFPTITAINKFHNKLNYIFSDDVEKYFYLYEYELASRFDELKDNLNEPILSSFMASHFLKPIILTTLDQFLLTFLQLGKYYMKRIAFRYSGIVVDEVHLINFKMLVLLLYFIKRFINLYKFNILFMSATFSDALMKVIEDNIGYNIDKMNLTDRYKELRRINYDITHMNKTLHDTTVTELVSKFLKDKKRTLIVVNTVDSAVKLCKYLEEYTEDILLLHGRFMYKDRIYKEDVIDKWENKPHILITTQVCEVSLDVSYDVLLTELAPLPSLVQRFGRTNRRGISTNNINAYIFKEYRKEGSKRYPYEDEELTISKNILEELYPLKNEYEIIKCYNEVENYERLAKKIECVKREIDITALWENDNRTGYFFSFKLDEEEARKKLLEFRDDITVTVLPDPNCIEIMNERDRKTKEELSELLQKWNYRRELNMDQINILLKKLRGYFISVPIWLVNKYIDQATSIPIIDFQELRYTSKYGLIDRGVDNII